MKTASEIDRSLNQTLTILVSAIIHAGLMVGICCSATEQKEKPIAVATKLIELKTTPLPPSPKKETPPPKKKDETPPPQKETPPPPPQKKETPPPKPVEQPKPVEVKPPVPTPAVVKTETPKPEAPKQTLTKKDDILARLNNAPTKKMDPQPPKTPPKTPPARTPSSPTSSLGKDANQIKAKALSNTSTYTPDEFQNTSGLTTDVQIENYAENCVSPRLYQYWNPSRAGMKYAKPSPVYITMTVSASGKVTSVQITTKSNDSVMNSSVEELLRQIRSGHIQFPTLASAGINRSLLTVTIGLFLKD